MATFTPNYGLHQWEPEDSFLRTDFNEDFQKIEETLSGLQAGVDGKSTVVCGSYVGTGSADKNQEQTITLGFAPRILLLVHGSGLAMPIREGNYPYVSFSETGFTVIYESTYSFKTNREGYDYTYLALR